MKEINRHLLYLLIFAVACPLLAVGWVIEYGVDNRVIAVFVIGVLLAYSLIVVIGNTEREMKKW